MVRAIIGSVLLLLIFSAGLPSLALRWISFCASAADAHAPSAPLFPRNSGTDNASEFEVATIRPVDPRASIIPTGVDIDPGGTVRLNGLSLKEMISVAFGVSYWQLTGGNAWMERLRYNVVAKPPEAIRHTMPDTRHTVFSIGDENLRGMLQSLLIHRFQLKVHREASMGKVYFLETTGKTLLLRPAKVVSSGAGISPNEFGSIGFAGRWVISNTTMPQLANFASDYVLHRPVVDRTGLTGTFNYESVPEDWTTYQADPGASFLQLVNTIGLKIKSGKGKVGLLVIDHAELPSPN